MAKVTINSGVCGFVTEVIAESEGRNCKLQYNTNCPMYKDLQEILPEVDSMDVFGKPGLGSIYGACQKVCKHGACPVPMGICKAVEVASGFALPKDVTVQIEK